MGEETTKGLAGVVAAETALSYIDGEAGRLWYRGYDIDVLAERGSYCEALYLLWHDALPTLGELAEFEALLAAERQLPDPVLHWLGELPADVSPMAVLRTAVSMLGQLDPEAEENSREANLRKASRLVARVPTVVAGYDRLRRGRKRIDPDPGLPHAGNFLYMLSGEQPGAVATRALDTSLLLYLEHGLNASTFTCRVVASTLADLHSALTAGLAALKGPLHGGANQRAMEMLLEIGEPDRVGPYVDEALAAGRRLMGFGHRVYRTEDPRAAHLRRMSESMGREAGDTRWHELSEQVEATVFERKGLFCNVDYYCGTLYYSLGLPLDLFTPLFAVGRTGGWAAHVMEQHMHNRLIRPRAAYTGEIERPYVPMDRR